MDKFIVVILICIYFLISCNKTEKIENNLVCLEGNECIRVEIRDNFEGRREGLMNRNNLEENEGMLFIFDKEDYHSFWMKNMSFPIDIIWMDESKKIVHIEKSVPPCFEEKCRIYNPEEKSKYVLEVVANFTQEKKLKIGDKLDLKLNINT